MEGREGTEVGWKIVREELIRQGGRREKERSKSKEKD